MGLVATMHFMRHNQSASALDGRNQSILTLNGRAKLCKYIICDVQ